LETSERGLDEEEARRRLERFGPNEIREERRTTPLRIFLGQFKSIIVVVLILAAVVSGVIDVYYESEPPIDTYVISAIVVMNAILGFVQEYRAEKAVEALKRMVAPVANVVRGGREAQVPSRELVPGDIILLDAGARISADARLLETVNLTMDEAPLTGESVPVVKTTGVLTEDTPVTERANMVFMGTNATYGRGRAAVTATGMQTSFGRIAEMVQAVEEKAPPLREKVERMGRQLTLIAVSLCGMVFAVGLLVHEMAIDRLFMVSVSLAVSAIPEGLPAVITITLALGVSRMARQRSIVRKLASVETLGSTTVICSDKTGTLTKGEMTVAKIYYNGDVIGVTGTGYEPKGWFTAGQGPETVNPRDDEGLTLLLRIGALCNNARLEKDKDSGTWRIIGDPTEGALVVAAAKAGIGREEEESRHVRIGEVPFSSERKRMTTVHSTPGGGAVAYVKGAPEIIVERCTRILLDGKERALTEGERGEILKVNAELAGQALRVLGMAYRRLPKVPGEFTEEALENNLVFVGLMGMIDPPREEAKEANRLCEQAGIKTVMITGDHRLTAVAVAREIGIYKGGPVLTGAELDGMSDEEFEGVVEDVTVYARVSPEHKLRIVNALKKKGHIVAMTGDGVNDAPAVKTADIGIAMGITGTDVTKEASDMVLQDDNFATIVTAVEGGRHIFDNITKYVRLMLVANFDEFFQVTVAALLHLPLPILATQILWINLVTDGLPAVALSIDPKDPDLMKRPPRDPGEGFLQRIWLFLLYGATVDFFSDFAPFLWVWFTEADEIKARTVAFTIVVFFEFLLAYNCRSETKSILQLGWKGLVANRMLVLSVVAGVFLQILIIYTPPFQALFHTVALTPLELALCALGACSCLLIFPGKLIRRPRQRKP